MENTPTTKALKKIKKSEPKAARIRVLTPYAEFVPLGINLTKITDKEYIRLFSVARALYEARKAA